MTSDDPRDLNGMFLSKSWSVRRKKSCDRAALAQANPLLRQSARMNYIDFLMNSKWNSSLTFLLSCLAFTSGFWAIRTIPTQASTGLGYPSRHLEKRSPSQRRLASIALRGLRAMFFCDFGGGSLAHHKVEIHCFMLLCVSGP